MAYHVSHRSRRNLSSQEKEREHTESKVRSVEQITRLRGKGLLADFLCPDTRSSYYALKVRYLLR